MRIREPFVLQVARDELGRLAERWIVRAAPLLALPAAGTPLLLASGALSETDAPPLRRLLLLSVLALQATTTPLMGAGRLAAPERRAALQQLVLAPGGVGSCLIGQYIARSLTLLVICLLPLPVWLLAAGAIEPGWFDLDLLLVLLAGPFVLTALFGLAAELLGSEVLGFLGYSGLLALGAAYLFGWRDIAAELVEIRSVVLVFLLWIAWAALLWTHQLLMRRLTRAGPSRTEPLGRELTYGARRVGQLVGRLWPRSLARPLLFLELHRPPAPPIGVVGVVTLWLLFIGLILDATFAVLPYWIIRIRLDEAPPAALAHHLWLVRAAILGTLLAPAALALASFRGDPPLALLRLTRTDRELFRAREQSVLALTAPLCLIPPALQLTFAVVGPWVLSGLLPGALEWLFDVSELPARPLALTFDPLQPLLLLGLCLAGQWLAAEVAFPFCRARRLEDGLLGLLVVLALLFAILPPFAGGWLPDPASWAVATLPPAPYGQPMPAPAPLKLLAELAVCVALAGLLSWRHGRRLRVPTDCP